MDNLVFIINF